MDQILIWSISIDRTIMTHPLNALWIDDIKDGAYRHPHDFMADNNYSLVQNDIVGTWRWGMTYRDIFVSDDNGELVGINYQDTSGDSEIDSYGMNVRFFPVEKKDVVVTEYVEI